MLIYRNFGSLEGESLLASGAWGAGPLPAMHILSSRLESVILSRLGVIM